MKSIQHSSFEPSSACSNSKKVYFLACHVIKDFIRAEFLCLINMSATTFCDRHKILWKLIILRIVIVILLELMQA